MGAHLWRMRHCVGSQFQRFAWLFALFLSVIFLVQRNSRLRRRMLWSTCGVCVREFHWLDLHRPFSLAATLTGQHAACARHMLWRLRHCVCTLPAATVRLLISHTVCFLLTNVRLRCL